MRKTTNKYSPDVRERAVRAGLDNQGKHESHWVAIVSISSKIGCVPQTMNEWGEKAEVDRGGRAGVTTDTPRD
jgi:transposase-like protein